jgi:nitric oxide reductase large subunit
MRSIREKLYPATRPPHGHAQRRHLWLLTSWLDFQVFIEPDADLAKFEERVNRKLALRHREQDFTSTRIACFNAGGLSVQSCQTQKCRRDGTHALQLASSEFVERLVS